MKTASWKMQSFQNKNCRNWIIYEWRLKHIVFFFKEPTYISIGYCLYNYRRALVNCTNEAEKTLKINLTNIIFL